MASWYCKVAAGGQPTRSKLLDDTDLLPLVPWQGLLRDYETLPGLDVETMVYGPLPASQQSTVVRPDTSTAQHPASTQINIASNRTEVSTT